MSPTPSSSASTAPAGYTAARAGVGVIDRRARGRIVVSGADRRSYLQGLFTNDIAALTPGTGCYTCYLTAQGRMISDLWVFDLGDVLLLTLPAETKDAVLAKLDQFIFSEDVQLGDVTTAFGALALVGPDAAAAVSAVVTGVSLDALSAMGDGGNIRATFRGQPAIVLRSADLGALGFEVLVDGTQIDALAGALHAVGAEAVSPEAAEALRIEGGIPLFGADMDEETIPLEAGIESRAISFTKGCYVGQEVIIRVLHRGHGKVARRLVAITLESGAAPGAGAPITVDGRAIGHVTSAVMSPARGGAIALGYVHRDCAEPGTRIHVGDELATVTLLAAS